MNRDLHRMRQLQPMTASLSDFQQSSPKKRHPRIAEINSSERLGISALLNKPDLYLQEELRKKTRLIVDRTKYIEEWLDRNIEKTNFNSNNSSPSSATSSLVYESPPQQVSTKKNPRSPLKDFNQLKRFKSNHCEKVQAQTRLCYSPVKAKENQIHQSSPKKLIKHKEKTTYEDNLIIESCLSPIKRNPSDDCPLEIMEVNSPAPSSVFLESIHSDSPLAQIDDIQSLSSPKVNHEQINIDESDHSVVNDENLNGSLADIDEIQSEHLSRSLNRTIDSDETFFSEVENADCTVVAKIDDSGNDDKSEEDERYKKIEIDDDDDDEDDEDDEMYQVSESNFVISEVTSQSVTNIDSTPRENFSIEDHSDLSQKKIIEKEPSVEEITHEISLKISQDYLTPPVLQNNSMDDNIISISSSPLSKQSSKLEPCDTIINAVVKKKKKKKPKKGSLVERLQTLVARKISSIRIWRHQMSQDHLKTNSPCVTVEIIECTWSYGRYIIDGKIINDDNDLIGKCVRENSLAPNGIVDKNLKSIKLLLVPEIVGTINFDCKNIIKMYPPWDVIDLNDLFINIFYFIVTKDSDVSNHEDIRSKMKLVHEFKCSCLNERKLSDNCEDKFKKLKPSFMDYLFQE